MTNFLRPGQRYTVIVEAIPDCHENCPTDGLYWIRTSPAQSCTGLPNGICEQTGVIRYNESDPGTPQSVKWLGLPIDCQDVASSALKPIIPWEVPKPRNKEDVLIIQALIQHQGNCLTGVKPLLGCFYWYFGRVNPKEESAPLFLNINHPAIQDPRSTDWLPADQGVVELDPVTDPSTGTKWNYLVIEYMFSLPLMISRLISRTRFPQISSVLGEID